MDDKRERKKYKILNVAHSGRKDVRLSPVKDPRYDGLIGSIIEMDNIENSKLFDRLKWDFVENKPIWYDFWTTSPIISISLSFDNHYVVETVNTIYVLEKVYERNKNEPNSGQSK